MSDHEKRLEQIQNLEPIWYSMYEYYVENDVPMERASEMVLSEHQEYFEVKEAQKV